MKRAISVLLIISVLIWVLPFASAYTKADTPPTAKQQLSIIIGDTDRDGEVTLVDVAFIEYYVIRSRGITVTGDPNAPLTDEQLLITDVDEDGLLTTADATAIQRYCLEIETFAIIGKIIKQPEPVTEPVTEPATEFVTEPVTEPPTEPATEHLYPTSITFNRYEIVLTSGQTYKLDDTVEPADVMDDTVTWYTDNPDVADVDSETGVIEAISKGCSSIIAETANGLTAECTVWVTQTDEEDIDEFGSGNINNYTTNYYDINYDITVNPTITTDTNNFLASTGDTTDRSSDIAAMLKKTGCCILGSGVFYIKGVTMPDYSMIRGQGNSTQVYWIDEEDSPNYIFKFGSSCSLSDMWIRQFKRSGSDHPITVQPEVRDFSAIEFSGVFNEDNPVNGPYAGTLSNLRITDIEGSGIRLVRTGTGVTAHVAAVNCYILRCDCGIHCDIISEFHQFTNITCTGCYYGVICRGGNNTFNNCNFSTNYVGIYLDNSDGQSYNNGHGIFNACVINHSKPNNTGTALLCDGINTGMKFSSCTFGYGNIHIKNSEGIRFYNCGMAFGSVTIENSIGTLFNSLSLRRKPDLSITDIDSKNTRFVNCFYRDGSEFIADKVVKQN